MKTKEIILASVLTVATAMTATAQNEQSDFKNWTLTQCLDYALEHNIDVLHSYVSEQKAKEDLEFSKQAFAPNISAGTQQGYAYENMLGPNNQSAYNASYGINLSMPIFNGGRLLYSKKQNEVILEMSKENTNSSKKDIQTSVLYAYLQVLYDHETVNINQKIYELSDAEYERSKAMYEVGKITKSALAQVASQWASNKYNLTNSKNNLRTDILALKQVLELNITTEFSVAFPEISDEEILAPLPYMLEIYNTAMEQMPYVKAAEKEIESAEIGKKIAQAQWMPTLNLNAGLNSSYNTMFASSLGEQFKSNLGPTVGVTLNIPLYDQRAALTSVNKAKLNIDQSKLNYQQVDKEISKNVETLYVEALNAQDNYITAKEKLGYAQESYDLVAAQFNVGMKNTIDMLTEEKNLFQAEQEVIQCRYKAVISIQLLNILQDKEIKVGNNN
ncbi:MAG: TolC family protein [Paludibacteraceae bacterium]|nr:TolC family protein [Paludibacteraceae bacterium]